jgi:hypothetical protein
MANSIYFLISKIPLLHLSALFFVVKLRKFAQKKQTTTAMHMVESHQKDNRKPALSLGR